MNAPLKLAILETDELLPALKPTYHSYGRMFTRRLERAGFTGDIQVFAVIDGQYPNSILDFDAYLITGSKHDAFADDEWIVRLRDYCRAVYNAGKPIIGICFGHQLVAHALGGQAGRADGGWGLGVMEYELAESALADLPDFVDSPEPVSLLISHRDQVTSLPIGARLLLHNEFCPYAGFYIPNRLLCFQGHPEFDLEYKKALLEYRKHDITADHMKRVQTSLTNRHEGQRIAGWMLDFLDKTQTKQAG